MSPQGRTRPIRDGLYYEVLENSSRPRAVFNRLLMLPRAKLELRQLRRRPGASLRNHAIPVTLAAASVDTTAMARESEMVDDARRLSHGRTQ